MNISFPLSGLFFSIAILTSAQGTAQVPQIEFQEDPSWEKVLKQAKEEGKMIFLDSYTSWCAPCKLMDREVFTRPAEARFFNQTFINVKYDMDRGEGIKLKQQFNVQGFPTYLFISSNGEILHRILGAYTAENEFLSYAKLALIPGETTSDLERRYRNGERQPAMMFSYLRAMRLTGRPEMEQELKKAYLSLISKDHFMDTAYWRIIKYFLADPNSREFKILLDNREEIVQVLGEEEVEGKIYSVINDQIRKNGTYKPGTGAHFDEDAENKLLQLLREKEFPHSNELLAKALIVRYKRNNDWDLYASVVDAMLDFRLLKNNKSPQEEFDRHAKVFLLETNTKTLHKRALRWSEYACELEKNDEKRTGYLQTKWKLQQKLGDL